MCRSWCFRNHNHLHVKKGGFQSTRHKIGEPLYPVVHVSIGNPGISEEIEVRVSVEGIPIKEEAFQ